RDFHVTGVQTCALPISYCLLDLKRRGMFVKEYVERLEDVLIGTLADLGVPQGRRMPGAPGVYVPYDASRGRFDPAGKQLAKIAADRKSVVEGTRAGRVG